MKLILENWKRFLNESVSQKLKQLRDSDQELRNKWAELQKRVRDVLKDYNREEDYKYIADRITCGESGTQEFGTQNICERDK